MALILYPPIELALALSPPALGRPVLSAGVDDVCQMRSADTAKIDYFPAKRWTAEGSAFGGINACLRQQTLVQNHYYQVLGFLGHPHTRSCLPVP
jgi:hypothetical protein